MKNIVFDYVNAGEFVNESDVSGIKPEVLAARETLIRGTGDGNDFVGWVDLPENYDREEYARIKEAAAKISSDSDYLLVIGIGGSYLGAKAAIEALSDSFEAYTGNGKTKIIFCGNSVSQKYIYELKEFIKDKNFSVVVISKSGTTTEPAVAFRVFKKMLEDKYGDKASERIYAATDKSKGALKSLADEKGYEEFVVPDNVGGRYSVLTAVGLLPIAVAGIDIDELMRGAQDARREAIEKPFEENAALQYAAIRNILYRKGKKIEILANFEPCLHYVGEWWKQLYGESEGKCTRGIFPASTDFTTDLHSMGQYIQDGERILLETVLDVKSSGEPVVIEREAVDTDGLNYLEGKDVQFVNQSALKGTIKAHKDGGVPVLRFEIPEISAYYLGSLFYLFEFACGVSGYTLGVNPFNQPGVEQYKKNMFELLGKPGYVKN